MIRGALYIEGNKATICALKEPEPPGAWREQNPAAFGQPVFLVADCGLPR